MKFSVAMTKIKTKKEWIKELESLEVLNDICHHAVSRSEAVHEQNLQIDRFASEAKKLIKDQPNIHLIALRIK